MSTNTMEISKLLLRILTALGILTIASAAYALPAVQSQANPLLKRKASLPAVTIHIVREVDQASPTLYSALSINEQLQQLGIHLLPSTPSPSTITQTTLDLDHRQVVNSAPSPTWSKMSVTLHAQTVYPEEVFVGNGDIGFRIFNSQPNTNYSVDITCFNGMDTAGTIYWQDTDPSGQGGQASIAPRQNNNFVFGFTAATSGEADIKITADRPWIFDQAVITAIPASDPIGSN